MIFDRTEEDVNRAKSIREEKVKRFEELSEEDIEILEKGCITLNTLNRIEEKQSELAEKINELGYYGFEIQTKKWSGGEEIFDKNAFERILSNTEALKKAFLIFDSTPRTPKVRYHYSNINDLEKILFDLERMAEIVVEQFRMCGAIQCGEGI